MQIYANINAGAQTYIYTCVSMHANLFILKLNVKLYQREHITIRTNSVKLHIESLMGYL